MNNKNKFFVAILENTIPLFGILFFGWSAFALLLSYWLETLVIGFFTILKMKRATKNFPVDGRNKLVAGPLRSVTSLEKNFAIGFFMIHYGVFCMVHFGFLKTFALLAQDPISFSGLVVLSVIPFFITHGKKFQQEFIVNKEYETTPLAKIMFSPYRRIVVMHVVVLFGGIPFIIFHNLASQFAILLIVLRVLLEVKVDEKAKKIVSQIDEKS
jgi:hypothetical protein